MGILLAAVSPIVNGYYPVLLTSIAVASSLELARRVSNDDNTGAIEMAAAVSELCVVVTTRRMDVLRQFFMGYTRDRYCPDWTMQLSKRCC